MIAHIAGMQSSPHSSHLKRQRATCGWKSCMHWCHRHRPARLLGLNVCVCVRVRVHVCVCVFCFRPDGADHFLLSACCRIYIVYALDEYSPKAHSLQMRLCDGRRRAATVEHRRSTSTSRNQPFSHSNSVTRLSAVLRIYTYIQYTDQTRPASRRVACLWVYVVVFIVTYSVSAIRLGRCVCSAQRRLVVDRFLEAALLFTHKSHVFRRAAAQLGPRALRIHVEPFDGWFNEHQTARVSGSQAKAKAVSH